MKILIRNSDNIVIYADDSITLTDKAQSNSWVDYNFNSTNATIADDVLPPLWRGAVWSYTNGVWTVVDTVSHAKLVEEDRLSKVPDSVTMAQAREALIRSGIMPTNIDAIILALPSPQKELAQNQWEYSIIVKRHNSWVSELAPLIPLTELQLDDLFILGATL